MGRLQRKKFRAHAAAAQPKTPAKAKDVGASAAASLSAAAVAAAFEGEADDTVDAVDAELSGDDDDAADGSGPLSRGQRKRMKRRSAFMRKMGLVNRVVLEKEKQKKKQEQGVFADIKELQDSLFLSDRDLAAAAAGKISQSSNSAAPSKSATAGAKPKKLSGKQRQKLAVRELGQLKAVHTHPQFQNDPFAAIQMHLQSTVVQQPTATTATAPAASGKPAKRANDMDVE
ncbi:hypothetical protein P43SY_008326 [Pythium insidiosum]|uniref:Ribosome biogenesis protein SLX9 n=1 Tax=Pythium insidiosum TaxID=114742 RepID=A0AAD5LHV7_PYTIN|nr:hypothetical protein P43SY_008326 [Pythium insidiosum]